MTSKLHRLLRKRIVVKKRRPAEDGSPRDVGVGLTGVIVSIVILGILAAIGGPPLFSLIFDAREHKLENNVREAAQIVQQRLTLEPEWMTVTSGTRQGIQNATDGLPTDALSLTFVEDAPYTWANDQWAFTGTDTDETIRVQFLDKETKANIAAASAAVPPKVDWIGNDWKAVRLHARNSDGRWACALIVVQAQVDGAEAGDAARYAGSKPTAMVASASISDADKRANARLAKAWISGIWYDSGDVVTDSNGLHDCSPVDVQSSANKATLPEGPSVWKIEQAGSSTTVVREFSRAL